MNKQSLIPKHWQIKKLGEVCDKISLNGIKIKQKDYLLEGKFPVVDQGQEIIGGYFNDEELLVPTEPPYIIFGDHTRVKKYINFKFIAGADGVKVLKPHSIFDPRFFFYLIHIVKIPDKGYARHFQYLEKEEIPIPPLSEQQSIVSKIEELFSDLENGKQQLLIAQQQLKVYRQSLLKWAFEGRFGYAQRRFSEEREGDLPEGWKWLKFGEVFHDTPQNGLYKPVSKYGSGVPILRIDGFYEGTIVNDYAFKRVRLTKDETEKYLLSVNDIVVNRVNSMSHLGKCGLVKMLKEQTVFESNIMRIRIKSELASPHFITSYLSSSKGIKELTKNAKHAVNQASINQTDVKNAIIPLPSLEEQKYIVTELEIKLTICNKIEEAINQSLQQTETLRQSILKKAFEGKLI